MGEQGEERAVHFLQQRGYHILDRNIRYRNTEIDIVALDTKHQEVVFVEVKTRSTDLFGEPSQAVDPRKLRSLQIVASHYLNEKRLDHDFRFDIVAVLPFSIRHYENISWEMVK